MKYLTTLVGLVGCAMPVDPSSHTQGLRGQAEPEDRGYAIESPPEAPPMEECWFAERCQDNRCGVWADDRRDSFSDQIALVERMATKRTSVDDLQSPECPIPNGIVACPHCRREGTVGDFYVYGTETGGIGPVVAVTNGYGAYQVIDLPGLASNGELFDMVISQARHVEIDFADATILQQVGPDPSYEETIYIQFSLVGDDKTTSVDHWVMCPPKGELCEDLIAF